MAQDVVSALDNVGWQLLRVLQEDSRLSFSELGRRVGLSSPAVAERVRRMEDLGILTGYRAIVEPTRVGYPTMAFIHLRLTMRDGSGVNTLSRRLSEVLECHHITGQHSYILKVIVSSMVHLEHVIAQLREFGETTTSIVLSSPVKGKSVMSGPSVRVNQQMPPISIESMES